MLQRRDAEARERIGKTVDAPRSCVPLDSNEALRGYLDGRQAMPPGRTGTIAYPRASEIRLHGKLLFLAGKVGAAGEPDFKAFAAVRAAKDVFRG